MTHITPSETIFSEIKNTAIKIWTSKIPYPDYLKEKLDKINDISNNQRNVMLCYKMFDNENQQLMRNLLSKEALEYININED